MKFKGFQTDATKEAEGVWIPVVEDLQLLIARMNNPKFEEAVRKLSKPHLRQIRRGTFSSDREKEIVQRALANHVLLGWKNLEDNDDKPIEYSKEKAYELLGQSRDFYDMVMDYANDAELFKQEEMEEAEGN